MTACLSRVFTAFALTAVLSTSACAVATPDAEGANPDAVTDDVSSGLLFDMDLRSAVQRTCSPTTKYTYPNWYVVRSASGVSCKTDIKDYTYKGGTVRLDRELDCWYEWTPAGTGMINFFQSVSALETVAKKEDGKPIIHASCKAGPRLAIYRDGGMMPGCAKCGMAVGVDLYVDGTFMPSDTLYIAYTETTDSHGNLVKSNEITFTMAEGAQAAIIPDGATQLGITTSRYVTIEGIGKTVN